MAEDSLGVGLKEGLMEPQLFSQNLQTIAQGKLGGLVSEFHQTKI